MKSSGSVLIVVLGLLAILAVIGITFITMSNLDRRTASNFAVQSQFQLAADGAVDYVCHHLVQDLWAYNSMQQPEHPGAAVERHSYYTTGYLLSDFNRPSVLGASDNAGVLRNEPFDHPGTQYDPWLSSPVGSTGSVTDNRFSYGYQTTNRYNVSPGPYGLRDWGTDTDEELRPNNLGFPAPDGTVPRYTHEIGQGPGHGVWIPDLSFPFETGLIRVSLTVLDHGGMLNLNAHGNQNPVSERRGYYISDVDPALLFSAGGGGTGLPGSFFSSGGSVPGLWARQQWPGNRAQLQVVIENPARYDDRPFTLDEEFELRRPTGTHFTSRLEYFVEQAFAGQLQSAPGTATTTPASNRLDVTTVGWTADIRPSHYRETDKRAQPRFSESGYAWRKVDLNLDSFDDLRLAIEDLEILDDDQDRRQFAANIVAFRDGRDHGDDRLLRKHGNKWGASRQPVFEDIGVEFVEEKEVTDNEGNVEHILQRWELTVHVINPWPELHLRADRDGLPVEDLEVGIQQGSNCTVESQFGDVEAPGGGTWLLGGMRAKELKASIRREIPYPATQEEKKLSEAIQSIYMRYTGENGNVTVDRIENDFIAQVADGLSEGGTNAIERGIIVDTPSGGSQDTEVQVVYIFLDDSEGTPKWFEEGGAPDQAPAGAVPVRFPKSVKVDSDDDVPVGGLPPVWIDEISGGGGAGGGGGGTGGVGFRAFRRVGDLNQVLVQMPRPGGEEADPFWPWVPRVAQSMNEEEKYIKFAWHAKTEGGAGGAGEVRRLRAASIFSAGGPWLDRIDNDGDGYADATLPGSGSGGRGGGRAGGGMGSVSFTGRDTGQDFFSEQSGGMTGTDRGGRFGGSEIRVAGKINLNTASSSVLKALGDSFGISGLDQTVRQMRSTEPLKSAADIVNEQRLGGASAPSSLQTGEAKGPVERRDLAYTLLSNIATVRSDTFSVYGTVQYIDVQSMYEAGRDVARRRAAVRHSRRFWALVDRSPCAAHNPQSVGTGDFIRPRVLNFQWMD
jgi:hypothetical protein